MPYGPTTCTLAELALPTLPLPCVQPRREQPRPRGWHGARRGPEEQYHPRDARVCCPAIEPTAHALRPDSMIAHCTLPFPPCLRRAHRLNRNNLGPEGGMALAEALKSNTTLKELRSAALPSTLPAHALRPHSMHAHCTGPSHPAFAVCAGSSSTSSAPRLAWRSPRP